MNDNTVTETSVVDENLSSYTLNLEGTTEPTAPRCGSRWHNTTNGILYEWNGEQNKWIEVLIEVLTL